MAYSTWLVRTDTEVCALNFLDIITTASINAYLVETLAKLMTLVLPQIPSSRPPTPNPILSPQNASGNTPLHWACLNGHLETVKILVNAGADFTITNDAGHDAVYEAEINDRMEVAEWLLAAVQALEHAVGGSKNGEMEHGASGHERGEGEMLDEAMQKTSIEDGKCGDSR